MPDNPDYKALISEVIEKQAVILGPDIAKLKARSVPGLLLDAGGRVVDVRGDGKEVLHKLIDEYVALSGAIVKNALNSMFEKYPEISR